METKKTNQRKDPAARPIDIEEILNMENSKRPKLLTKAPRPVMVKIKVGFEV